MLLTHTILAVAVCLVQHSACARRLNGRQVIQGERDSAPIYILDWGFHDAQEAPQRHLSICDQKSIGFATSRCRGKRRVTATIGGACEFIEQMLPYLERALEHPDMTEELADVLLMLVVAL
jgi:hypothetical protein